MENVGISEDHGEDLENVGISEDNGEHGDNVGISEDLDEDHGEDPGNIGISENMVEEEVQEEDERSLPPTSSGRKRWTPARYTTY